MDVLRKEVSDHLEKICEWKRWEKTDISRKDLVTKSGTLNELLDHLTSDLSLMAKHLKVAHWQRTQYQKLKESLPPNHCILTIDFAENYLCKYQQEVQSAHWSYRQVTVHPCVFFYRCPKQSCHHIVTDYKVFLTDDLKHDAHVVKFILHKCLTYLASKKIVAVQIFSDGCSSQYKSKLPFLHLQELQIMHPSLKICRHYFGSNHGKSLCDSSGGTVKNCASAAVKNGQAIIQSSKDMFEFCNDYLSISPPINGCQHLVRSFVHFDAVKRPTNGCELKALKGTRDFHCIRPTGAGLDVRALSCFCSVCLVNEEGVCENEEFVLGWSLMNVKEGPVELDVDADDASECSQDSLEGEDVLINLQSLSKCRVDFFVKLQEMLSACSTYAHFKSVCLSAKPFLSSFDLYVESQSFISASAVADKIACSLRPAGLELLYPVLTEADGNCMPRALSIACFGTDSFHIELRCRAAIELCLNRSYYLEKEITRSMQIALLSPCGSGFDLNDFESLPGIFDADTMYSSHLGHALGLWQVEAFANVLGVKIVSIYPTKGPSVMRKLLDCHVMPRKDRRIYPHDVPILWTSNRSDMNETYWVANHIVPLLPFSLIDFVEFQS
ncbi:hypothetical protein RRG08_024963 [Elysia crispata]|uniref:Vertnin n=1 Tax=Elysia crispata TaxID=231223 RepID=A0AAE0Z3D5_9GAST|nr:hypothetical protein RRG08_024963 [Elysia crispata]